jgi:hypothetical protein
MLWPSSSIRIRKIATNRIVANLNEGGLRSGWGAEFKSDSICIAFLPAQAPNAKAKNVLRHPGPSWNVFENCTCSGSLCRGLTYGKTNRRRWFQRARAAALMQHRSYRQSCGGAFLIFAGGPCQGWLPLRGDAEPQALPQPQRRAGLIDGVEVQTGRAVLEQCLAQARHHA